MRGCGAPCHCGARNFCRRQRQRASAAAKSDGRAFARSRQKGQASAMKILAAFLLVIAASQAAADTNDYPTEARADYVFVCMKTNGENQEMLRRCSCSIDVIASLLP